MRTADFDFDLPPALIAQTPAPQRDESRLLVFHRGSGHIAHRQFRDLLGEVPLPPYISRADTSKMETDRERYQTVFARLPGSVAAPTAGLHFTQSLLEAIRSRGVRVCFLTLHVGLGTFAPVKTATLAGHTMHEERFVLSEETACVINEAKRTGRRIIAVGTTTLRVLESQSSTAQLGGKRVTPSFHHSIIPLPHAPALQHSN